MFCHWGKGLVRREHTIKQLWNLYAKIADCELSKRKKNEVTASPTPAIKFENKTTRCQKHPRNLALLLSLMINTVERTCVQADATFLRGYRVYGTIKPSGEETDLCTAWVQVHADILLLARNAFRPISSFGRWEVVGAPREKPTDTGTTCKLHTERYWDCTRNFLAVTAPPHHQVGLALIEVEVAGLLPLKTMWSDTSSAIVWCKTRSFTSPELPWPCRHPSGFRYFEVEMEKLNITQRSYDVTVFSGCCDATNSLHSKLGLSLRSMKAHF